jgi:hypothetical protein
LKIEVAYSPGPRTVDLVLIELPAGATVAAAIEASGLRERHAELKAASIACGIWGRVCRADRVLSEGDRVEIYRPLALDPKEARRARGREQKQAGQTARKPRLSGTGSA